MRDSKQHSSGVYNGQNPPKWIEWAEKKDFPVPEKLKAAVEKYHGTGAAASTKPINNNTEFNALTALATGSQVTKTSYVTPLIPGSERLEWLVALLCSKKFRDRHENVRRLSSYKPPEDYYAAVLEEISNNKPAMECLERAKAAVTTGEIEIYGSYYLDDEKEISSSEQKISTASFILWAERSGYKIPVDIMEGIKLHIYSHVSGRQQKEKIDFWFPALSLEKFNTLTKEPLWKLSRGFIYLMGHNSERSVDEEIEFLQKYKTAKKLTDYAYDSCRTGKLKLIDCDLEMGAEWQLKYAKVDPQNLIDWARNLPLVIPILANQQASESDKTSPLPKEMKMNPQNKETLLWIVGVCLHKFRKSNFLTEDAGNPLAQHLIDYAEKNGIKSKAKETLAKGIREARAGTIVEDIAEILEDADKVMPKYNKSNG